jgi:hypothetical protein
MVYAALNAFEKAIQALRRDLDGFANFFTGVRYAYYHAEPPTPVPDKVWRYIVDDYEVIPYDDLDDVLDVSPDGTAGLTWDTSLLEDDSDNRVVAVRKFELLCRQCFIVLQDHIELLAVVPEIQTVAKMPQGHHPWIRLIHGLAAENPLWSDLVAKHLVVIDKLLVPDLAKQGEAVPDIWVEQIRGRLGEDLGSERT